MRSQNEWDKLTKVIVGVADYARVPVVDLSVRTINYADRRDPLNVPVGQYPQQIIDEFNGHLPCRYWESNPSDARNLR